MIVKVPIFPTLARPMLITMHTKNADATDLRASTGVSADTPRMVMVWTMYMRAIMSPVNARSDVVNFSNLNIENLLYEYIVKVEDL